MISPSTTSRTPLLTETCATSHKSQRQYVSQLVPATSQSFLVLIILASISTALTNGYDAAMMSGLNTLPQYYNYFTLNDVSLGLNTSSVYIGGVISSIIGSEICDRLGRKPGMLLGSAISIVGVLLQTAAQNIAMFVIGRLLIGLGTGVSGISAPVYISETAPVKWRAFALGIMNDFWHVGAFIAAGVTYGTFVIPGSWSWRIPSLVQAVPSLGCIAVLPFIPESPRYLISRGRKDDGREVLAVCHCDGDTEALMVQTEFDEIIAAMELERSLGHKTNWLETIKGRGNRMRMLLVIWVAICCSCSGNNFIYFYLGPVLKSAGLRSSKSILGINIGLQSFGLIISIIATVLADRQGRRGLALWSAGILTVSIFLIGGLIKVDQSHESQGASIATIFCIFGFFGGYAWAWTPLAIMYPPEILNYSIRASGLAIFTVVSCLLTLFTTFVFPFIWNAIGWKTYMINGAWDALQFVVIYFLFVETKGKTLEEIDALFDGPHLPVPSLSDVDETELVLI